MLRLNDIDSMYLAEELAGFAKRLAEDGVVPRQVDLLVLGFAYAVRRQLPPPVKIKRHDLLRAGGLDADTRLALESVAPWYARELGAEVPTDPRSLLDLICRLGSAGLAELQRQWEGRAKSQIELSIFRLIQADTKPM